MQAHVPCTKPCSVSPVGMRSVSCCRSSLVPCCVCTCVWGDGHTLEVVLTLVAFWLVHDFWGDMKWDFFFFFCKWCKILLSLILQKKDTKRDHHPRGRELWQWVMLMTFFPGNSASHGDCGKLEGTSGGRGGHVPVQCKLYPPTPSHPHPPSLLTNWPMVLDLITAPSIFKQLISHSVLLHETQIAVRGV